MSVEIERATMPCGVCGAQVSELRRGRCWGCYTRWGESRPVGKGASCAICHERRRGELRLVELQAKTRPLCHSCAGRIARLDKVPRTINAIRVLLDRERRARDRRGDEAVDHRIFPRERRVGERRAPPRATGTSDTDPHIMMADLEDIVIELVEADIESVEQTIVRERQAPPAAPADAGAAESAQR